MNTSDFMDVERKISMVSTATECKVSFTCEAPVLCEKRELLTSGEVPPPS